MDLKQFDNLESKKVFEFFEAINQVPRVSKHEKEISDFLVAWAKERNLTVHQDDAFNVIIIKDGQGKLKDAQPVILQGHMDMVGEKGKNSKHDFFKDPIESVVKDGKIYANDTTLGSDDGIGVAYAMALLDDKELDLPPLEVIITTDEETGMSGAMAIDVSMLKGKIFINIDNEEEGVFCLSCAGGNDTRLNIPVTFEDVSGTCLELEVTGGLGGHSGVEIDKQRANSNKVMARYLNLFIENEIKFNLIEINGGTKFNAITRDTLAKVVVDEKDIPKIKELIETINKDLKTEYTPQDPDVHVVLLKEEKVSTKAMTLQDSLRVVNALELIPNGIISYSQYIPGLVQTSTNIGILETKDNVVSLASALRSSVISEKQALIEKFSALGKMVGAEVVSGSFYPAWAFNPDSRIKELFVKEYKRLFDKEPVVQAIHAGLECGLFKEKMGDDVDFISFGPTIEGAHTNVENLDIGSADRSYKLLVAVLQDINSY